MSPKSFEAVRLKFCRAESRLEFCFPPRSHFILAAKDLAEIRGSIPARFWPLRSCFPARISTRSRRDFGRRDSRFPARFAAGSRRDFGRRDFCFPARITARFPAGSRRDFGRREARLPTRILPGSRRDSRREKKSRRPKSPGDPGGIPVEIAAGSRQDPSPYFTRVKPLTLQAYTNFLHPFFHSIFLH